jgi:uncharacterized membrane protein YbhN (UPF0104 family)
MRHVLVRSVLPLVALVVVAAIVFRIAAGVEDLRSLPPLTRPWLILAAAGLLVLTVVAYVALWRAIMFDLDRARPRFLSSGATFTCSWLGRYVPTSAPYVAGKVILGERLGHRRSALAGSVVYENLIVVLASGGASAALLAVCFLSSMQWLFWTAIAAACFICLALLASRVMTTLLERLAFRVPQVRTLARLQLTPPGMTRAVAWATLAGALNGMAFIAVLFGFTSLDMRQMVVAGAAFNVAGAAGIAAVPVPSGIIVREAVLVGILQAVVPLEIALAAAMLVRFLQLPVDVALGGLGAGYLHILARQPTPITPAELAQRAA